MPALIGLLVGAGIAGLAAGLDMDRDRSLYAVILLVVASYYPLFAIIVDPWNLLIPELGIALAFGAVALLGYLRSLWIVSAALVVHGLYDVVWMVVPHPAAPAWWSLFCAAVDIALGVGLLIAVRRWDHGRPPDDLDAA